MPTRRRRARVMEIANLVEAAERVIHIEKINGPMLFKDGATPHEYWVGLQQAIEKGWITYHESGDVSDVHARRCGPVRLTGRLRFYRDLVLFLSETLAAWASMNRERPASRTRWKACPSSWRRDTRGRYRPSSPALRGLRRLPDPETSRQVAPVSRFPTPALAHADPRRPSPIRAPRIHGWHRPPAARRLPSRVASGSPLVCSFVVSIAIAPADTNPWGRRLVPAD